MPVKLLIIVFLIASSSQTVASELRFSDQTAAAGLTHTHNSAVIPWQIMHAGGAVGDFNGDGYPDLFVLGGGAIADALYINNTDGTFTDRADAWGLDNPHSGVAATVADYDDDGDDDIYVTSFGPAGEIEGPGNHLLYSNEGGFFINVADLEGVATTAPYRDGYGSAFGDYDRDGDLDLFVGGWHPKPPEENAPPLTARLFRNDGDGSYTNVTEQAGVITSGTHAFGAVWVDMDGDRYPELLVAGDFGTNRYYRNNRDGTFTELDPGSGLPTMPGTDEWTIGKAHNGMGTTVADLNRDGRPDWFVTAIWPTFQFESDFWGNGLYLNQGDHIFSEVSVNAGVNDGGWGWGTSAVDLDNDGWIDLAMTNGWPFPDYVTGASFVNDRSLLWRNRGDMTFDDVGVAAGFEHTGQGRTMLHLDYDRDGDMDMVILPSGEPMLLLRNDVIEGDRPLDAHWVQIKIDTSGNPDIAPHGVGALITVDTHGGVTQTQQMRMGGTYLGQSELIAHFGIGDAKRIKKITIDWGDGKKTRLGGFKSNQRLTVNAVCKKPGRGKKRHKQTEDKQNCSRNVVSVSCESPNPNKVVGGTKSCRR